MALFGDSVDCRFFSIKIIVIWYVVQLSWIFLVRALFIFTCTACTRGTLPPNERDRFQDLQGLCGDKVDILTELHYIA